KTASSAPRPRPSYRPAASSRATTGETGGATRTTRARAATIASRRFMPSSLARPWYGQGVLRVCAFDLDHTLVQTPLDLAAMAVDMRALLETRCGPLPARPDRYRVGELIHWCQTNACDWEKPLWEVALDHERRAMGAACLEAGAREAIEGARAAGFATA